MRLAREHKERRNAYPVRIIVIVRPERSIRREKSGRVQANEDIKERSEARCDCGEEDEGRTVRGRRAVGRRVRVGERR